MCRVINVGSQMIIAEEIVIYELVKYLFPVDNSDIGVKFVIYDFNT